MTEKEKKAYFDGIVKKTGITSYWTATGYILPDGTMLSFANTDVYPDPTVSVYNHDDLEKFFDYKNEDMLLNGAIRVGFCDANDKPFIQMQLKECEPTDLQWAKISELLQSDAGELDVEADININSPFTSFYKKYTAKDNTIEDIQDDIEAYIEGDATNWGTYSEKLGVKDSK